MRRVLPALPRLPRAPGGQVRPDEVGHRAPAALAVLQRLDAGQPVDATAEVSRTIDPSLHQKFAGPTEMMDFLAKSEHVEQVFVRYVFRYFLGRNESLGDANTLQDAHKVYRASGGSFNELVVSLLSSDSFLLRQLKP